MLHIFTGSNREGVLDAYHSFLADFLNTNTSAQVFELEDEISEGALREHAQSTDMFGGVRLIKGKDLFTLAAGRELFAEVCDDLVASVNTFVLLEGKVLKKDLPKAKKGLVVESIDYSASEKSDQVAQSKIETRKRFAIGDLLGARDRKALWVGYHEALMDGQEPEEIFWTWQRQLKNMFLAGKVSESDSGLHPFVYKKSKSYASKFSEKELLGLLDQLIEGYAQVRRGGLPLDLALERFIMKV